MAVLGAIALSLSLAAFSPVVSSNTHPQTRTQCFAVKMGNVGRSQRCPSVSAGARDPICCAVAVIMLQALCKPTILLYCMARPR